MRLTSCGGVTTISSPILVSTLNFQFHGVTVSVRGAVPEVAAHFKHDFHFFLQKDASGVKADLSLEFLKAAPRWGKGRRVGRAEFFFAPPGERRLRYFKKAFVQYAPERAKARVYAPEAALAYEAGLAVLLSFVGEWLDRRGIHRVHGLGVAGPQKSALFLAPSGTGKSTLALGLLRGTALKLLSDDTPLVDVGGQMREFPQRIATRERPSGFLPAHLRKFKRVEYGEKFVLGAQAFAKRVGERAPVDCVVITTRHLGPARLTPLPRWKLVWPLTKWLVVGYETPQMWELFLRPSRSDLKAKLRILGSRVGAAARLWRGAQAYTLSLGDDRNENVRLVETLLKEVPCV